MSHFHNLKTAGDEVPKLTQIAIQQVAQLIANEKLPSFDYQIVASLSQSIFEELRRKQNLSYKAMRTLCTRKRFLIDRIDLTDNKIERKHLKLCSKLDLISFRLGNYESYYDDEIYVPKILKVALNPTSCQQLRHLGLNGMGILNETWPKSVAQKLPSLESLSFDGRPTTNLTFALIGANLSQLCFLSMSNTNVTDISCISGLKNLEVLILYNLEITNGSIETLAQLSKLRVLDISRSFMGNEVEFIRPAHVQLAIGIYDKSVESILNGTPTPWLELRAINLSGLGLDQFARSNADPVKAIIMAHPKLEQIGLLDISLDPEVAQVPGRNVQIFSNGSGQSLNSALSHYVHLDRKGEIWHILRTIRTRLETQYDTYSVKDLQECLHLMCSMKFNYMFFEVEAGHCLFEICRERLVTTLSVRQKNNVINRCLDSISSTFYIMDFDGRINNLLPKLWQLINQLLLSTNESDYKRLLDISLIAIYQNRNEEIERSILKALAIVTSKMQVPENGTLPDETQISNLYRLLNKYLEAFCLHFRTEDDIDEETALNTLRDTLTILSDLNHHSLVPSHVFSEANGFDVAVRILEEVEDIMAHIGILKIILFFIEFGKTKLCKSKFITILLSCADCDFNKTNKLKLHQTEEKSYLASSILYKLLTDSSRHWENNQQKTEVSEMLLRTTIQYSGLYRPRISFSSCFRWNAVMHFARYDGVIMWILWSVLYLLQHDKYEFLTLKHSGIYEYCADSCLELFSLIQDIADGHKTLGNRYLQNIEKLDHRVIEMAKRIIALVDEDVVKIFTIPNRSEEDCSKIKILTNKNGEKKIVYTSPRKWEYQEFQSGTSESSGGPNGTNF